VSSKAGLGQSHPSQNKRVSSNFFKAAALSQYQPETGGHPAQNGGPGFVGLVPGNATVASCLGKAASRDRRGGGATIN
jgi:hypothetical protein